MEQEPKKVPEWHSEEDYWNKGFYVIAFKRKRFLWISYWSESVAVGMATTYESALTLCETMASDLVRRRGGYFKKMQASPFFTDEYRYDLFLEKEDKTHDYIILRPRAFERTVLRDDKLLWTIL